MLLDSVDSGSMERQPTTVGGMCVKEFAHCMVDRKGEGTHWRGQV